MPSKLNTEFNYRYQVEGNTPWAKINTLKSFYEGRVRTMALEQVSEIKYRAKLMEIEHLKDVGAAKHLVMIAQAELIEAESFKATEKEAFELNRQEVAILEKLLAELYAIAEPTRLKHADGTPYTDEEMFEANAANEFTTMIGREIHAEMLATGRPSPAKLRNAMLYPGTFMALQKIGLIPAEANILVGSVNPLKIELDAVAPQHITNENVWELPKTDLAALPRVAETAVTEIFATPLYSKYFTGDIGAIKKYVESIEYNEYVDSKAVVQSKDNFILQNKIFTELKTFIEAQLLHYCKNIFGYEDSVLITQSWVNKSSKGKNHRYHTHPNSVVSGVFYINLSDDMPPIQFYRPQSAQFILSGNNPNTFSAQIFGPKTTTGDLILFPSTLPHSVPENQSDIARYSLSFNTFISNPIGDKHSLTYLDPQMR